MAKLYFFEVDVWGKEAKFDKFYIVSPSFLAVAKFIENSKVYSKRKICVITRSKIGWGHDITVYKIDSDGNQLPQKDINGYESEEYKHDNGI